MTVAELLSALAREVVSGRAEWEVDVSILKVPQPPYPEPLRLYGNGLGDIHHDRMRKKILIKGEQRSLGKGEI